MTTSLHGHKQEGRNVTDLYLYIVTLGRQVSGLWTYLYKWPAPKPEIETIMDLRHFAFGSPFQPGRPMHVIPLKGSEGFEGKLTVDEHWVGFLEFRFADTEFETIDLRPQ